MTEGPNSAQRCGAGHPRVHAATSESRPIVLAADAAYAMPLATTLRSITDANRDGWPLSIHIFSDDITSVTRQRVLDSLPQGSVSIHWHPVDLGPVRGFATADHISKMTYARFLIPEIFPKSVSRVLYLDTDLLALAKLESLWETDLDGAVVGAVLDTLDAKIKGNMAGLEYAPRVGSYFNAGVLLIDVDRWREEGVSSRALEYLARNPRSPYSDQDALNVVCDGRWKELGPQWNWQHHLTRRITDIQVAQRPAIIHFVTSEKPWKPSSLNLNAAFYDTFRARTGFAQTRGERIWNALLRRWYRTKAVLREYEFLRFIWVEAKMRFRRPASM